MKDENMTNALLADSTLPNKAPDFDNIKSEDFVPAVEEAIKIARAEICVIKESQNEPDFSGIIEALDSAGELLGDVLSVFYNQLNVAADDEMMKYAEKISVASSSFSSEVSHDPVIFEKVKAVYDKRHNLNLNSEQLRLLENTYKSFVRNGALLGESDKKRLADIDMRLSVLSPVFADNVKKSMESYNRVIEHDDELSGIPETVLQALADNGKEAGQDEKYVVTLDMPVFIPVMKYADNRKIREELWRAYNSRAWQDEFDNSKNIIETVSLRYERAKLLGYKTHAHYVLEKRMAKDPDTVTEFVATMKSMYKPKAITELNELREIAKQSGLEDEIKPWDVAYYSEKLRKKLYDYSSEDLRVYFPLDKVLNGVFEHFEKLFGIEFTRSDSYSVWHKDVIAYEVTDKISGDFLGTLYGDFYPRKGKKNGAWMTSYREQGLYKGKVERPVIAICCNFPKPSGDEPSLLTHDDVLTLLHEAGHAMHGMLSDVTYRSLSGTNVFWDFVELPSQLQENWGFERESLDMFSSHYKTGEKIPQELFDKVIKSKTHMSGWMGLRQTAFCVLDMGWHNCDSSQIDDVAKFEEELLKDVSLFPKLAAPVSASFSHIFAGGYSAGYYSYKWAEVLDADAFEMFKEKGIYDRETADKFRYEVLAKGGSADPAKLYENFRGREPDPQALFRRENV